MSARELLLDVGKILAVALALPAAMVLGFLFVVYAIAPLAR